MTSSTIKRISSESRMSSTRFVFGGRVREAASRTSALATLGPLDSISDVEIEEKCDSHPLAYQSERMSSTLTEIGSRESSMSSDSGMVTSQARGQWPRDRVRPS